MRCDALRVPPLRGPGGKPPSLGTRPYADSARSRVTILPRASMVPYGGIWGCLPTVDLSLLQHNPSAFHLIRPFGAPSPQRGRHCRTAQFFRYCRLAPPSASLTAPRGGELRCPVCGRNTLSRGDSQGARPLVPFQIGGPGGRNRNLPPGRFFCPFLDGTRNGPAGGMTRPGHRADGPMWASAPTGAKQCRRRRAVPHAPACTGLTGFAVGRRPLSPPNAYYGYAHI